MLSYGRFTTGPLAPSLGPTAGEEIEMRKKLIAAGAGVVLALGVSGGAVALAGGGDGGEGTVTGAGADAATAAALEATNGGHANSVERDNENGATWEVEVTRPDGTTVDVRLDDKYRVVVIEGDSEAHDGNDAGD